MSNQYIQSFISLLSDFIIITVGYLLCTRVPFWNGIFSTSFFTFLPVLSGCLVFCAFISCCFDCFYRKKTYSSTSYYGLYFILTSLKRLNKNKYGVFDKRYTYSFFLLIIKLFFIPLMLQFSINNFFGIKNGIYTFLPENIYEENWVSIFNNSVFPFLLSLCFFVDTIIFLFGYLIYSESLGNTIRSVETSFLGWFSALLCYPPFFAITGTLFPAAYSDYPFWINENITFALRLPMLLLLIIYTLATINLGWKASNLTNRGIVSHGVYSVVRHPAYIAKNLFWWLSLLPVMFSNPISVVYMLGISAIYFTRAVTEERHLFQDSDYQDYCQKVKYRFIPKIF